MAVAILAATAVWILTSVAYLARGQVGMAALAFFAPPVDLVLAFFISTALGAIGICSVVVFWVGAAMAAARRT
jgi:hypothetical protein